MEIGSKQRKTVLKFMCDRQLRPKKVYRKTDCLYFAASLYFLHNMILTNTKLVDESRVRRGGILKSINPYLITNSIKRKKKKTFLYKSHGQIFHVV